MKQREKRLSEQMVKHPLQMLKELPDAASRERGKKSCLNAVLHFCFLSFALLS